MPSETKSASGRVCVPSTLSQPPTTRGQQAQASTGSSNKDHSEKGDEPSLDPTQEPRRGSATGSGAHPPKPSNNDGEEGEEEEVDSDDEPRITDEITNHHVLQPGEVLDQAPYVRKKATKPMMEINAGSNVWYQATIVHETRNEAKVLFPAPEEGEEDVTQWVHKASNRIWGGSLKSKDWKYLGKGAWAPKKSASAPQGKGGPRKGKRRRGAGVQRSGGGGAWLMLFVIWSISIVWQRRLARARG